MIKVSVLYPNKPDTHFDFDYYPCALHSAGRRALQHLGHGYPEADVLAAVLPDIVRRSSI